MSSNRIEIRYIINDLCSILLLFANFSMNPPAENAIFMQLYCNEDCNAVNASSVSPDILVMTTSVFLSIFLGKT